MRRIKKLPGFSLIEMSMVLLILGIVGSLTLPLLTSSQAVQRQKATEANQDSLFRALAAYVLTYDHLPSPSSPTLQGKSDRAINVGIIPYQELGIPEALARDGYGNWFTYAINSKLGREQSLSGSIGVATNYCNAEEGDGIKLMSLGKKPFFEKSPEKGGDFIAAILISHGLKGTGAFHPTQDERRTVFHPLEAINSNIDSSFFTKVSTENDPNFDHKIYWVTRNNLMAVYAKNPCLQTDTHRPQSSPSSKGNPLSYYNSLIR